MLRFSVALVLLTLCVAVSAQEWVEHGGAEYNCNVLRGILAEYGDSDLSRSSGGVMTVAELFAVFFPSCPRDSVEVTSETSETGTSSQAALFSFSSDEEGLQPVLGPIALPAGVYVFTATTGGYLSVAPQSLSGDCGFDLEVGIFHLSEGEGVDGSQAVVEVERDCNVLLGVSNNDDAWLLEIDSADDLTVETVGASYSTSSALIGLQPVLGPLMLPKGVYVFTATSDGYLSVAPQSLSGDCGFDLEVGIFHLTSGEAADGAQSVVEVEKDCDVLLEIGNSGEAWQLEFNKIS